MRYKKILQLVVVFIFMAGSVHAITITDNYYGGDEWPDDWGGVLNPTVEDVVGTDANYGVSKMEVTIASASNLSVNIYSNFLDNIGISGGGGSVVELGDLFVSNTGWNPYSAPGELNYNSDVASNGEIWEYVLVLSDHSGVTTSGAISLYSVDSTRIIHPLGKEMDSFNNLGGGDPSGGIPVDGYRSGQEVQYNTDNLTALATGNWFLGNDVDGDFLNFSIDTYDLGIAEDRFGLHWTMTCANDVIEGGANPVPEPATMLLFGLGLSGVVGNAIRKRKK